MTLASVDWNDPAQVRSYMARAQARYRARMTPEKKQEVRDKTKQYDADRRENIRSMLANWKLDHGCADCGDRWQQVAGEHPEGLEFDHPNGLEGRSRSDFHLTNSTSYAGALDELDRVEVVCAICHAFRTAARRRVK